MLLAEKSKNALLEGLAGFINTGQSKILLNIYTQSNTLLATFQLPNPAHKLIHSGILEFNQAENTFAVDNGSASYAKLFTANGDECLVLTIGTDITISSQELFKGGTVSITDFNLII